MADVLPTQPQMSMGISRDQLGQAPLPNPPFVFPTQPEGSAEMGLHKENTSSQEPSGPRRSTPRFRPQQLSFNDLPAFDFTPSALHPSRQTPSPSRSPSRRTPPPHHHGRHKRNDSEFVGGSITEGGPLLVSSSPTRSEYSASQRSNEAEVGGKENTASVPDVKGERPQSEEGFTSRPDIRLGAHTTRRSHAHKRSGAISSHDLSMILKPASDVRAGSAPTTPSDAVFNGTSPEPDRSMFQPTTAVSLPDVPPSKMYRDRPNIVGPLRGRVAFSDELSFIPRPLSTISSETSSSMSTVRASHSVTDSITSVFSAGTSTPPSMHPAATRRERISDHELVEQRPHTADALSLPNFDDSESEFPDPEAQLKLKRPSSAPTGDSSMGEVDNAIGLSVFVDPTKANPARFEDLPHEGKSNWIKMSPTTRSTNSLQARRRSITPTTTPKTRARTSPEPKVTKRQRKGRSWTGLLSRKGKYHVQNQGPISLRMPLSLSAHADLDSQVDFSFDNITFDEDTSCIIDTELPRNSSPVRVNTETVMHKSQTLSPLPEPDGTASVLDIDAALSDFDIPSTGPNFEEIFAGTSSGTKRRMHSSGATGGFMGPGMHYHRRGDSNPEMDDMDRSKFGFPRLGSDPSMAIEEEEEDEDGDVEVISALTDSSVWVASDHGDNQDGPTSSLGVSVVEADNIDDQSTQRAWRRSSRRQGEYISELARNNYSQEVNDVEIVGADEEPRFSVVTKSSDESTITPTLSRDPLDTLSPSEPPDFAMPTPALTYGTPNTPSVVSSPDFTQTSFDSPRIHTATSSITDRATLNSSRIGDQSSTMHGSLDDVPSLTSSASTMSARPPRFSSSANVYPSADRSSSLSAAVPSRTRAVSAGKRSSLASLSRLVGGGSYNKSKLNIAECLTADNEEQTQKKKGNRISRMMRFWKSKEKSSAS